MSTEDFVPTWTSATKLLQAVEDRLEADGKDAVAACFTEDATIHFADLPEMRGHAEIAKYFAARFARARNFLRDRTLRALMGNIVASTWDATWTDSQTGKEMVARGTEIWTLRGAKIADWDATFNVREKDGPPLTPVT